MKKLLIALSILPVMLGALVSETMAQASYPDRPITLVVPYRPGGSSDLTGRFIAEKLTALLGQPFIIDNKGGTGVVGAAAVAAAKPDGYTIGYLDTDLWAIRPHREQLPYDIFKDMTPVAYIASAQTGLTARNDMPFSTLAELITYAKANPGKVSFASAGAGSGSHLLGEALKAAAGIDLVHVPYQGSGAALTDQLGGRVDLLFNSRPVERVQSKQVKGIAIMSKNRVAGLPDLPSIYETFPDFPVSNSGWGFFVPAGTPAEVVTKLEDALHKVYDDPSFQSKMTELGYAIQWTDSEALKVQMKDQFDRYGEILKTIDLN